MARPKKSKAGRPKKETTEIRSLDKDDILDWFDML